MIRLRPVEPGDRDFLAALASPDSAGRFNTFRGGTRLASVSMVVNRMVIELEDGTRVGDVQWFGVPYGPNEESCARKIGITVHPEHRGKGIGTEAQRLLADYLFESTLTGRVEADTDVENVAEQRALEKAGFVREGILRGAQYRAGERRDLVLYSKIRDA